jgi:hypothetical protein
LSRILVEEHGFRGDTVNYDNPANADLIAVLDRKRGIPVSLSILYVAMARRTGWSADALNTPGHVLVRIGSETAPILVDPFNGGRIVDGDCLAELAEPRLRNRRDSVRRASPADEQSRRPRAPAHQSGEPRASGRQCRARADPLRADDGGGALLWPSVVGACPARDQPWRQGGGSGSLSAMLEMTRDPVLRTHISATLDALAGS